MNTRARLTTAALAVALTTAVAAAPATAASKVDKKQTKAIVKLDKRTKAAGKKLNAVAKRLGALSADLTTTKNGLATIQAAVPTVVSSLKTLGDAATQLKAGLESAGAGLTALKTGVETLGSTVKGSLAAAEYGVVQLYFDPEGDGFEADDAVPGQILVSPDVPDDGNQATVTGRLLMSVPNGTTAKPVALKAGMRSGEKDGTGATNPAGVAGLMAMTASSIGGAGSSVGGGNSGGPTSLPILSKPNAAAGGLPVSFIPNKAPRSDATPNPLSFPDALAIELTDPATLQAIAGTPGRFTVTNTSGAASAAIFDVTVRFHDLSASATDVEE